MNPSPQPDNAQWFVIHADIHGPVLRGPYTVASLLSALRSGTLAWVDLIYDPNRNPPWLRVFELRELQSEWTKLPEPSVVERWESRIAEALKAETEAAAVDPTERAARNVWYLQLDGTEFGPFVATELVSILRSGKLSGPLYCWKEGMANWQAIDSGADLTSLFSEKTGWTGSGLVFRESAGPPADDDNKRAQKRRALVATVAVVQGGKRGAQFGICNDISETGLQVICSSDNVVFKTGQLLDLEIAPVGASGLSPFRTAAKVVWTTQGSRRVGFTFVKVAAAELKALNTYISKKKA